MTADLTPIAEKLAKCIRLLGSDNRSEIAAAFHGLKRTLKSVGANFNDLGNYVAQNEADMQAILEHGKEIGRQEARAQAPFNGHANGTPSGNLPNAAVMMHWLLDHIDDLAREKDRDFVRNAYGRVLRWGATPRQQPWIEDLYIKTGGPI